MTRNKALPLRQDVGKTLVSVTLGRAPRLRAGRLQQGACGQGDQDLKLHRPIQMGV
jgi:hypothetical protein